MTHYFIRRKTASVVELGKFEPDRSGPPVDVYRITGGRCDCPSPKHPCKHNFIVQKWRALPDPIGMYYDDRTETFNQHPLALWLTTQTLEEE